MLIALSVLLACGATPVADPLPAPVPVAAPAPVAAPVEPKWRGDYCASDAECGWDDPCTPTRCGSARAPSTVKCEESARPPGTCGCVQRMCTTRWTDATAGASLIGCAANTDCAIDIGTGTCHLKGNTMVGPIDVEGPMCRCDTTSKACVRQWVGPIACTSFKDCGFERKPRAHPIVPTTPRDHPVKMCEEGSIDAVCNKDGACQVVIAGC